MRKVPLNRITSATDNTGNYTLSGLSYDKNGNILSVTRQGHINETATNFGVMDDLVYAYDIGNKLLKVEDTGNDTYGFKDDAAGMPDNEDDYTYDTNGNMSSDTNKGITSISYNHLNLPTEIIFNDDPNQKITYFYAADGTKQQKVVADNAVITTTDYVGSYIYENGSLKFINHAEGYLEPNGAGGYAYVYQYKDHLGNVRLSYADSNGDGLVEASEIRSEKNYYPFGMLQRGYNGQTQGTYHPYGFNGKEEQSELELEWLDFSARNYDAALGRWMNLDPLAEDMRRHSPYNYGFDNPVYYTDPDGMAPRNMGGMDDRDSFDVYKDDWDTALKGYYADNYTGEIVHFPDYNKELPGFTFLGDDDATVVEIQDAYKKFKEAKKFLETMKLTVLLIDLLDGGAGQTTKKATRKVLLKRAARLSQQFNTRVYKALKNIPAGWKVKKRTEMEL